MSLLALAVFSFFSYPFKYPFAWVMLFLSVAVICNTSAVNNFTFDSFALKRFVFSKIYLQSFTILLSVGLLVYSVILTRAEMTWKRIARFSLGNVLPEYEKLYSWLGNDGLFLYNHAAELHKAKEFEKSIAVFERCTRYHNDIDVQLFLVANYRALEKYVEVEQHLKIAAAMCPARFMPLYELAKLYDDTNRKDETFALAKKIIDKDVKVPSHTINAIKQEMRMLIEVRETVDVPASADHTPEPTGNEDTRQGETLKVRPDGAALPP
jgi:tetratricopeptide (TPR) repeat protein